MIKRTIEVSSGPCRLSVRDGQLIVERERVETASVPCEDIGVLIVDHPAVRYTHGVLTTLLEHKAAVVICGKGHLPDGVLLPFSANLVQAERIRLQVSVSLPTKKRLWRQLVQAKLRHQAQLLGPDHPVYGKLLVLARGVKSGDPENREAQGARVYWAALFPEGAFRRKREGDPPNDLLNYGYSVLRAAVARAICGAGLHPSIGVHHQSKYNPYCLADDLLEPFRPMVDARVRDLWREGKAEIDRESKTHLLQFLADTVETGDTSGPFLVALPRMMASLCRCFKREEQTLEIPVPWRSPDTERCG